MKYYKIKIKKVKTKIPYYLLLILIIFNFSFYSIIYYKDHKFSNKINYSYKNILKPSTKEILSKGFKNIKIKDFITNIVNKEYDVYWVYPLFIDFLMNKKIKKEIKYNLIIYTITIFKNIKVSSLFLDLEVFIYTYWKYDKKDILKLINKSLKIDNNLINHKVLLSKRMINLYSNDIIKIYKAKTLSESNSYFNYLLRTNHYKDIVNYINNNKINIDIKSLDRSMAANIIKIGDFEKSETIMLNLIKKEKYDYLYYYLAILYINYKKNDESIKTLEKLKELPKHNKQYILMLADLYYKNRKYVKAIETLLDTNNYILKKYCYIYLAYVNKLPILERELYLKKVQYICNKKQIYKVLSEYYKKTGNMDKYDFYNLEMNIIK